METIEISEYVYYVYSSRDGSPAKAVVMLYDSAGYVAGLFFSTSDEPLPPASRSETGTYSLYYCYDDLPVIIDMLRNECPIYLHYNGPVNTHLSTAPEPVGEGEG